MGDTAFERWLGCVSLQGAVGNNDSYVRVSLKCGNAEVRK